MFDFRKKPSTIMGFFSLYSDAFPSKAQHRLLWRMYLPFDWPLSKDVLTRRGRSVDSYRAVYRILLIVRKVDSSALSDQPRCQHCRYQPVLWFNARNQPRSEEDHESIVYTLFCTQAGVCNNKPLMRFRLTIAVTPFALAEY